MLREMEGLSPAVQRQIIADFYRKNVYKGEDVYFPAFWEDGMQKNRHISGKEVKMMLESQSAEGGVGKAA